MKLIIPKKNNLGFTIIELVVVLAVFLFIIGAGIGIFLSIIQSQKRVLSEQQLLNQVSYAEEHMSKALRTAGKGTVGCLGEGNEGRIYVLTHYDPIIGAYMGVKFLNQSEKNIAGDFICQEFLLDVASQDDSSLVLWEKKDDGSPVALTSNNLKIDSARFVINGSSSYSYAGICTDADPDQCVQPRLTMVLNVIMPGDSQTSTRNCSTTSDCLGSNVCDVSVGKCVTARTIQTTVSQRNLNIPQ